jgi:Putative adhesin
MNEFEEMTMTNAAEPSTGPAEWRGANDTPGATTDQAFAISGRCRFSLDNPGGRARITGWDRPEVHLQAIKRGNPASARYQATRVEYAQDGDTVYVRSVLDPTAALVERGAIGGLAAELVRGFAELLRFNNAPSEVDYEIKVPSQADLDLKGVSSNIQLDDVAGAIRVRSVSGEVTAARLRGEIELGSVSGDVRGRDLAGQLALESVSGDVKAEGDFGDVRAKTVSGEIELATPLASGGSYEFHSVSGDAIVRVPSSTAATISARGLSSDFSCDLPCDVRKSNRVPGSREWQAELNGGGAAVRFQSVSGNLRIRELVQAIAEAAAPTATSVETSSAPNTITSEASPSNTGRDGASSQPTAEDDDSAAMAVLRSLERGDLTVDDALRQIEALRASKGG